MFVYKYPFSIILKRNPFYDHLKRHIQIESVVKYVVPVEMYSYNRNTDIVKSYNHFIKLCSQYQDKINDVNLLNEKQNQFIDDIKNIPQNTIQQQKNFEKEIKSRNKREKRNFKNILQYDEQLNQIIKQIYDVFLKLPVQIDPQAPIGHQSKVIQTSNHNIINQDKLFSFSEYNQKANLANLQINLQQYIINYFLQLEFELIYLPTVCNSHFSKYLDNKYVYIQDASYQQLNDEQTIPSSLLPIFIEQFYQKNIQTQESTKKYLIIGQNMLKQKNSLFYNETNIDIAIFSNSKNLNSLMLNQTLDEITRLTSILQLQFQVKDIASKNLNFYESRKYSIDMSSQQAPTFQEVSNLANLNQQISINYDIKFNNQHPYLIYGKIAELNNLFQLLAEQVQTPKS